jgi:O-antigen ligase
MVAKSDQSVQGILAQTGDRYEMYQVGFEMFQEHPVAGVGIGHFAYYYRSHQYSHSDYIEPLATTGLIGFLLYQSFNCFVLLRAFKLAKWIRNGYPAYVITMIIIGMMTIMLLGLGAPNSTSLGAFILLTTFSVRTYSLKISLGYIQSVRIRSYSQGLSFRR